MKRRVTLVEEWRQILRKAWSVRLMALAAILSGLEIIVPLYATEMPRGAFALVSFFLTCAAFGARFVAQRSMTDDDDQVSDKPQ